MINKWHVNYTLERLTERPKDLFMCNKFGRMEEARRRCRPHVGGGDAGREAWRRGASGDFGREARMRGMAAMSAALLRGDAEMPPHCVQVEESERIRVCHLVEFIVLVPIRNGFYRSLHTL